MTCVIVANGEFCTHKIPLNYLKNADFIIACDGAANTLLKNKIEPNIIIGDLDSFKNTNTNASIISIKEQVTNDLTKAYNYALKMPFNNIYILGASGLREDHFIANFALLFEYYEQNKNINLKMITNYGEFFISENDFSRSVFVGQQISFFCLDLNARFSSNGLRYELDNFCFKHLNDGTLNEATQNKFSIINHDKKALLTYLNFS